MSRIKPYNYRDFSIFEIQDYLERKGFQTKIVFDKRLKDCGLDIIGSKVSVDLPHEKDIKGGSILPSLRFEDYPKTETYEKDKKLYEQLKRKFGIRKSEKIHGLTKEWD